VLEDAAERFLERAGALYLAAAAWDAEASGLLAGEVVARFEH